MKTKMYKIISHISEQNFLNGTWIIFLTDTGEQLHRSFLAVFGVVAKGSDLIKTNRIKSCLAFYCYFVCTRF